MTAFRPAAATLSGDQATQCAATLLRVTMGGLFLFHGAVKLFIFTPAGTAGYQGMSSRSAFPARWPI